MPITLIKNGVLVTANGEFSFETFRVGTQFLFSVSGAFGGGTATLGFVNALGVFTPYGAGPYVISAAAAVSVYMPPSALLERGMPALSLVGATSPSLTVILTKIYQTGNVGNTAPAVGTVQGLGANVATALTKPTGTNGAVQLVGDVLTPPSITLPDVTGVGLGLNNIGMDGGRLVVGSMAGNVLVAPRRYTGMSIVALNGKAKSKAFTKVFGIPMTAAEMTAERKFKVIGHVTAMPNTDRGTVIPYTNLRMGWAFNTQIAQSQPMMGMFEMLDSMPLPPPATFNSNYAANRLQRTRYDIATLWGHPTWPFLNLPSSGDGGSSPHSVSYLNGGGNTVTTAVGTTQNGGFGSAAQEIAWMFQVDSNEVGNYTTETMIFEWDVEIQTVI